jgi:hypothetical protein
MVHRCVIKIGSDVAAHIGSVLVDVCMSHYSGVRHTREYVALFGSVYVATYTCVYVTLPNSVTSHQQRHYQYTQPHHYQF